jgi:hypothetical protein
MTRYISKLQAVNWNRGLHRVFALLCMLWAGYLLVWLPMQARERAYTYAIDTTMREYNYAKAVGKPLMSAEELDALTKENLEMATWSYQYRGFMKDLPWLLAITILIPALIYGLIRLFLMLLLWLYRGFNTPKEGA